MPVNTVKLVALMHQINRIKVATTSRMLLEPLVVIQALQVLELAQLEQKLTISVACNQTSQ